MEGIKETIRPLVLSILAGSASIKHTARAHRRKGKTLRYRTTTF
jgi:hypothetical protein